MKHNNLKTIIYSINIEDIQNVAENEFGKKLTIEQLKILENKIGDYFNWYDTIEYAIEKELELEKVEISEAD